MFTDLYKVTLKNIYSKKSVIRRKKVIIEINDDDSDDSEKLPDNVPSEDEIKLHWKTLMKFNKMTWDFKEKPPVSRKEINEDDRDIFFIGMSICHDTAIW